MEDIEKLQEYAEYLQSETLGVDTQIADGIAEQVSREIEAVTAMVKNEHSEWKAKVVRLFETVRESVNIILAIYNTDAGIVPHCISRIVADFAYLRCAIIDVASDDEYADVLADNTAIIIDELCEGDVYVQDREKWFERGIVQNALKSLKLSNDNQPFIDGWHSENINPDAKLDELAQEEIELLKLALDKDKTVGTVFIQSKLNVGYVKALAIIDRMEKAGVVSTREQTENITRNRILRVTYKMLNSINC